MTTATGGVPATILERAAALKGRIRTGTPTVGLLMRTPAPQLVEAAATAEPDFLAFDAEHAPFGPDALDHCLLAAHAAQIPALVRIPDDRPATIQMVLDLGAAGIIVPHVHDRDALRDVIAATRLGPGGTRGLSTSHRAAGYGQLDAAAFIAANNRSIAVIAQVEDEAGLNRVDELAAEPDLDALFIGRADLACSLGADSIDAADVEAATRRILAAGLARSKSTGIFLPVVDELEAMLNLGASLFLIDTDQGLLARALRANTAAFRNALKARIA